MDYKTSLQVTAVRSFLAKAASCYHARYFWQQTAQHCIRVIQRSQGCQLTVD